LGLKRRFRIWIGNEGSPNLLLLNVKYINKKAGVNGIMTDRPHHLKIFLLKNKKYIEWVLIHLKLRIYYINKKV